MKYMCLWYRGEDIRKMSMHVYVCLFLVNVVFPGGQAEQGENDVEACKR